jgi:hypothetical protein
MRDVALVLFTVLGPLALLATGRLITPADGTATFPSAPAWGDGVVIADMTGTAGDLRPGDRVVSVDGMPLEHHRSVRFGQKLLYRVHREDGTRQTVAVTLGRYPLGAMLAKHAVLHPFIFGMLAIAAFVLLRRPGDVGARALFRAAAFVQFGLTAFPYATQVVDVATGRLWPLVVADTASLLMWGALLHFALVFPRARGPVAAHPRLTALVSYALPIGLYGLHLVTTLPGEDGALERTGRLVTISVTAANTVPFLVAAVMVGNFLTTRDPVTRQRMAWVFAGFGFGVVLYLGLGRIPERITGSPLLPWDWLAVCFLPFPLALAAAVLRYRLFDVQVIVRRSLVYGALAAVLCLVYFGAAHVLSRLTGTPVGVGPLLAGALVVVLVLSLRQPLHRTVMRLVFGDRDDPYEVLRSLGQRLEATAAVDSVLDNVVDTLANALRLPYVAVRVFGPPPLTACHGQPTGTPTTMPLVHRGEEVGWLALDTGPLREPFGPAQPGNRGLELHGPTPGLASGS